MAGRAYLGNRTGAVGSRAGGSRGRQKQPASDEPICQTGAFFLVRGHVPQIQFPAGRALQHVRWRQFPSAGLRLSRSQGMNPKAVPGIAVSIMRCRDCGLVFPAPLPIPDRIEDHYGVPAEEYWDEAYFNDDPGYFSEQILAAKQLIGTRPHPTALDIGAGAGKAMKALSRAGFDTYGLEPSASFRHVALTRGGIPEERILLAKIEDADFAPEQFDFITFGAVLEHLYDPAAAIERAMRWLRPGGVVQIEVPNSNHFMTRVFNLFFRLRGTNFVSHVSPMHSPFHIYEFTLDSFRAHAARTGYTIARHCFEVCRIYHLPAVVHPPLRWYMDRTDSGMQLTVHLTR